MTAPGPPRTLSRGQKSQGWTTGCSLGLWTLLLGLCLGILHPQFLDIYGSESMYVREEMERRRMQGRTHSVNEPLRFSTSENLLLGHLTPKSRSSKQTLTALSSCSSFSYSLCYALRCCFSYFDSKQQIFCVTWRPLLLFFQRTVEGSGCCWSGFWETCNLCKKPPRSFGDVSLPLVLVNIE